MSKNAAFSDFDFAESECKELPKKKKDFKTILQHLSDKYEEDKSEDGFVSILTSAVESLDRRQEQLHTEIQDFGSTTSREEECRVLEAKRSTFFLVMTVYKDLRKLDRIDTFN